MGHLILIAEELVKFLSRCPPDLVAVIQDSWTQSEWDAFVEGTLQETKARDARPLAGGKPMPANAAESDTGNSFRSEDESDEEEAESKFGEPLTRTVAQDGFADRRSFDSEGDEEGNTVDRVRARISFAMTLMIAVLAYGRRRSVQETSRLVG
jgi:SIT4-associating protein SAP185/190